jgi:hypothetical protein
MKNITVAIDDETLEAGRSYASRHQTTLNSLVRELLVRTVLADRRALANEMFRLMDAHPGNSEGKRWTREQLYVR